MLTKKQKIRFLTIRTIGNFLILLSVYGMVATFGPVAVQEGLYHYNRLRGTQFVVAENPSLIQNQQTPSFFTNLLATPVVQTLVPTDTEFSVVIPKIAANARVVANIDPGDYVSYMQALKVGVAHAAGTGLPGVTAGNRNVYLFAHSTDLWSNVGRYNAIFYLLKELEKGDEIDVFFEGKRFIYLVDEKKVVEPDEVDYLTTPKDEEQLTLQTCWPPGTTLKRLLVFAKPKGNVAVDASSSSFAALTGNSL